MTRDYSIKNTKDSNDLKLFETAPGMRLALLPDAPIFTIAAISRDLCRLFDTSREQIVGQGFLDACRAYDAFENKWIGQLSDSLHSVIRNKTEHRVERIEFSFIEENMPARKNNWTSVNTPVLNELGEIEFIIYTSEEHDSERESRLRQTFSIETVGVIYFDLDGGINDANPAFVRMSGYSREDFINGKVRWDKLTPSEFMEVTNRSLQEFLRDWKNTPYEKQYIRPDGSRWWGLFAGKRLSENECVEFVLDITLLKQVEEELDERVRQRTRDLACLNQELQRSNNSLEEFAYAASHDLKEPIRKIQIFLDRLNKSMSDKLTQEDKDLVERIFSSTKRMNSLIEDLLLYSHVNMYDKDLQLVDLNELINVVLADLDVEIESRNATIEVSKLFSMQGRPRQLQQVFHNLIGNSLKYSRPDASPLIQITCRKISGEEIKAYKVPFDTDYHLISIKDNGIGFEQAQSEHIFSVFARLHSTREFTGTGVGLSIVRKVVEKHRGFITAESNPGEGATFRLLFPVANQGDPAA